MKYKIETLVTELLEQYVGKMLGIPSSFPVEKLQMLTLNLFLGTWTNIATFSQQKCLKFRAFFQHIVRNIIWSFQQFPP